MNVNAQEISPWLKIVAEQVETLRFGVVQIIVHDNRVVQIEKTEKVRLDKPEPRANFAHQTVGGQTSKTSSELTERSEAS